MIINRFLYENGEGIFDNAVPSEQGFKEINAMIVGFGAYGRDRFVPDVPPGESHIQPFERACLRGGYEEARGYR